MSTILPPPPTEEENDAALAEFFAEMKQQRAAVAAGLPAAQAGIRLLVEACAVKTGQSYHLRSLLYSLWNGKPTRLVEIVNLDRALRDALLDVMRVFGADEFFYDEISGEFKKAVLMEWFIAEREEK